MSDWDEAWARGYGVGRETGGEVMRQRLVGEMLRDHGWDELRSQIASELGADPEFPSTTCQLCREAWAKADRLMAMIASFNTRIVEGA